MSFSKKYFFSSHELSWRSRHGELVNITSKDIAAWRQLRCQFWAQTKNSANWCAQQSSGIPRKTASLILLTVLFVETYLFPTDNLKNKLAKLRYT